MAEVIGLSIFKNYFGSFCDNYVIVVSDDAMDIPALTGYALEKGEAIELLKHIFSLK